MISLTSSQRVLKHQQRKKAIRPQDELSQSSIQSSPSAKRSDAGVFDDQAIPPSSGMQQQQQYQDDTLRLPAHSHHRKGGAKVTKEEDLSLAQLINNSLSINNNYQVTSSQEKQKYVTITQPMRQNEIIRNIAKQNTVPIKQDNKIITPTANDVYSQLRNIRTDLQKVRQAHIQMTHDSSDSSEEEDENISNNNNEGPGILTQLEERYKFLVKGGRMIQTRDGVQTVENHDSVQRDFLEMNNKLILEAYTVSKRREYVQHHIGEMDMSILDTESPAANDPYSGYAKAMEQHIKQSNVVKRTSHHRSEEEDDDSSSQNALDHEFTGINLQLLTEDKRLQVQIGNYDNHYRLYFENPEAFQKNQIQQRGKKGFMNGKVGETEKEELEKKAQGYFLKLSESEQVDAIGKMVPQFGECMRDLQQTRLKYQILLDRIKRHAPQQFKTLLQQDRLVDLLGIQRDLQQRFSDIGGSQPQTKDLPTGGAVLSQVNNAAHQRRKATFGENSINNTSLIAGKNKPSNLEDSHQREVQRIKEQLGDAESKLKDAQLQRLQEKVKGFAATEKHLRTQISEVEKRDESLVTKLETAVCFGKIMITSRPLIVSDLTDLLAEVKYHSLDKPLQKQLSSQGGGYPQQQNSINNQSTSEASLPERIDESIGMKLEVEFNELYNILRNPTSLKEAGFASRFALVSPDAQLLLYQDVHMTQEVGKLKLIQSDFLDMGILIQNNKENKRMMFFKVVNHNLVEKQREVFLMSVFEDQIPKWENCLDPSDDIKFYDRTFKLIKDRLLKAVIDRSKKLQSIHGALADEHTGLVHLDNDDPDLENWDEKPLLENAEIANSFQRLKESRKTKNNQLASSDEEEYSVYEKNYQQHVTQQSRKLYDAGLNMEHMSSPNPTVKYHHGYDSSGRALGKTDDLNRELENINTSVQQRVRSKLQAENEKEDKQRQEEQQKRLKAKQAQNQEFARAFKALSLGTTFLKYGAMGPPKQRHVFLQENGKRLYWKDPGAANTKGSRYLVLKEITSITEGRQTKKFKRFKTESTQQVILSFTLHTKKRTLDLEAASMNDKTQFIANMNILMQSGTDKKGEAEDEANASHTS